MSPKGVNELKSGPGLNSENNQADSVSADASAKQAGTVSRGGTYGVPDTKMFLKDENKTYPEIERFIANHLRIIASTCKTLAERESAPEATVSQGGQSTLFGKKDGAKADGYMPELADGVKSALATVESGVFPSVDVGDTDEANSDFANISPGA